MIFPLDRDVHTIASVVLLWEMPGNESNHPPCRQHLSVLSCCYQGTRNIRFACTHTLRNCNTPEFCTLKALHHRQRLRLAYEPGAVLPTRLKHLERRTLLGTSSRNEVQEIKEMRVMPVRIFLDRTRAGAPSDIKRTIS